MLLENAIKKAKDKQTEHVGISIRVEASLRDAINVEAKKHGISTNNLITSILELALNDSHNEKIYIHENLDELYQAKAELEDFIESNGHETFKDGTTSEEMLRQIKMKISVLEAK